MVGFFPGFKMPYHIVNTIASRVWRKCGLEDVMTTANGYMLFRFKSEEEMQAVLEKGPWMFGGKTIILQQWHPRFCFDKSKISTLPVWIRIHGLPFPLWSKQGLSLAASMVGRPLSCDEQTYNCTRLEYARVCVEIDASLPFMHHYEIDSPLSSDPIPIAVEYEWKPSRCDRCKIFGHSCSTEPAPLPKEKSQTHKPPIQSQTPPPQQGTPIAIHTQVQPSPGSLAATFPKARQTHELTPTPPQPMTTQPPVNTTHQNSNIQPTTNHAIIPHTDIQAPHDIPPIPPKPALSQSQKVAQLSATENHIIAQDSGTVLPDPETSYLSGFNPITCIESKMDSLRNLSASSSAAKEDYAETSTTSISSPEHHDISPPLVRKKKGGKKRKEARGL
jgi:hypothetical protein